MSTTDATTYPHPSGDAVILGPETFADKGKTVICHQGENYYPRPLADDTYVAEDADGDPTLWLKTDRPTPVALFGRERLRVAMFVSPFSESAMALVDRLWDAIAATAGEAPKDGDDATDNGSMWCIHVQGPDDILPAKSRLDAMQRAHAINSTSTEFTAAENDNNLYPTMWAVPTQRRLTAADLGRISVKTHQAKRQAEIDGEPEPTPEQVEAKPGCTCVAWRSVDPARYKSYDPNCPLCSPPAEQVEADLAQDEQAHTRYYAQTASAPAEEDAIDALVRPDLSNVTIPAAMLGDYPGSILPNAFEPAPAQAEAASDSPAEGDRYRLAWLSAFAARVLEVGGQQPGVPVESVREAIRLARESYGDDNFEDAHVALPGLVASLEALLPGEPTS